MGMIRCKKHGRTGISLVCSHIEQEIEAGSVSCLVKVLEPMAGEWSFELYYCRTCAEKAGFQDGQTIPDTIRESDYETTFPTVPVCSRCFREAQPKNSGAPSQQGLVESPTS